MEIVLRLLLAASMLSAAAPAAAQSKPVDPFRAAAAKLEDSNPAVRRQGTAELARLRDPRGVALLLGTLKDDSPFVRASAVDALGLLRSTEATKAAARLVRKDPAAQVRQGAAVTLGYLNDASSADALIEALSDKTDGVRFAAARSLGILRAAGAVEALSDALKDSSAGMRRSAAGALGQIGDKTARKGLTRALRDDDPLVRQEAAKALGALGDEKAAKPLKKALRDDAKGVRLQAANALARLGDNAGVPAALELLKDKDSLVRQQASSVLAQIGASGEVLRTLDEAIRGEKDPYTKQVLEFSKAQFQARLGLKEKKTE